MKKRRRKREKVKKRERKEERKSNRKEEEDADDDREIYPLFMRKRKREIRRKYFINQLLYIYCTYY